MLGDSRDHNRKSITPFPDKEKAQFNTLSRALSWTAFPVRMRLEEKNARKDILSRALDGLWKRWRPGAQACVRLRKVQTRKDSPSTLGAVLL